MLNAQTCWVGSINYTGQNSKTLKTEQTRLIGLLVAKIRLVLALEHTKKRFSACFQLIAAMFPLCHLKHHFCAFCGQIMTCSSAFSHWLYVFICLQLNWPALSFTSQKTFLLNYSIFFLLHYNKSLFLVKLRCFQVYHNKTFFHLFVTKFSRF